MNNQLFSIINSFAGRSTIVDLLAIFLSEILIFLLLIFGAAIVFRYQKWPGLAIFILSIVLSYLLSLSLGVLFSQPRPAASQSVIQLTATIDPFSFPSKHTSVAATIAAGLYLVNHKLGLILLGLALLVGVARIFVGVHYPVDILVGFLIGVLTVYLVQKAWQVVKLRRLGKFQPVDKN